MKIIKTNQKETVIRTHYQLGKMCCEEMQELMEHPQTKFSFGEIRLILKDEDEVTTEFTISHCPFCGEKVEVIK